MKNLGYYAKSMHTGILRPFKYGEDKEFYIKRSDGTWQMASVHDFEIIEVASYTEADDNPPRLGKQELERRLVLLLQVAKCINDELAKMGFADADGCVNSESTMEKCGDDALGKHVVDLFILADKDSTIPETEFRTNAEYEMDKVIYNNDYIPIHEKERIDPKKIEQVAPMEFVVGGENFVILMDAYNFWRSQYEHGIILEVFQREWVHLKGKESPIECNVKLLDFLNNTRDENSIAYELWEWVKNEISRRSDLLPFEITWEIANAFNNGDKQYNFEGEKLIHDEYDLPLDDILCDIMLIDQMELGGRGFIEFDEDVAKQNVETVLHMFERYRGEKLV